MKRLTGFIAAFALIGVVAAGCSSQSGASNGTQTAEGVEKQIEAIRNNPNMPQQAKDAAINAIQAGKAQGEAASQQSANAAAAQKSAAKP